VKEVNCAEVGYFPDCDVTMQGQDEGELMARAGEHARQVHGLTEADFTDERVDAIRRHIHDV
jgi:predicted small metal-binding protein